MQPPCALRPKRLNPGQIRPEPETTRGSETLRKQQYMKIKVVALVCSSREHSFR